MGFDEPSSKRPVTPLVPKPGTGAAARRKPWQRRGPLIAALLVVGFVAWRFDASAPGYGFTSLFSGSGATGRGKNIQAPPVRVAATTAKDVPVVVHTIGTVLANATVNVKPQIDGQLLAAMFKEGQMVKKGDLLFRIDPAPFEAAQRQADAQTKRDQAQAVSARADADRAVTLAERGIVAAQQRDQLVAAAKALEASVEADQAAADRAKLNLDYTTIRSPINGKTGAYAVHPGNQIHASDAAGLVTITQIQPVKITFNLPQGNLPQLQDRLNEGALLAGVTIRSDTGTVTDAGQSAKEIPVKVDFIGNVVDDKTGTIELRATFDNPDLRLVPGELVDVSVNLQTLKNIVTVPRDSVNIGQDGNYVYVVDKDRKVQVRPVKVLFQDQTIAALGPGIEVGERVVTDGQLRLTPGIAVSIVGADGGPKRGGKGQAGSKTPARESDREQTAGRQGG